MKKFRFLFITYIFLFHIILVPSVGAANKIMPLGDSITWDDRSNDNRTDGERIAYRYRLWQLLNQVGVDFDFVGGQYTGFDVFPDAENEGHRGWSDDDIAASVYNFLVDNPARIILLHIGTNDLETSPLDVENILNEIDRYEADFGIKITVLLARIINRSNYNANTTIFNDNVEDMAFSRVNNDSDPAYPDRIIFGPQVDMEDGAGINYSLITDDPPGDMWDILHPFETGYSKMAEVWFSALMSILPQADAGTNQDVYEFETVTLNATGSNDPKSGTLTYQWTQTDGTSVVLSNAQAPQPTFTAPGVGISGEILTFRLTVTDEDDLVSTDTVSIDVQILPQANAGPDQAVHETGIVKLDASGSIVAAGGTLTYQWTQTAGTSVVLSDAQVSQPTFTAPGVGISGETLTFELTVAEGNSPESKDTVNIAVKILPLADAGPDQTVSSGGRVTLDASGSVVAAGGTLTYEWLQTSGPPVVLSDNHDIQPFFIAPALDAGSSGELLTFELTVEDAGVISSPDYVNITVKIGPQADAGSDQSVDEFDPVTLDASGSGAAGGGSLSYQWTQTAGASVVLSNAQAAQPTFTAPDVGANGEVLTFQLTVTDKDNLESTDFVNITVHNPDSSGGGGGGGGCFIATAADGSPMTLPSKMLLELRSHFAWLNWNRLMAGDISLLTPRAAHAATSALVVTMVVLISSCVAIALRKPRKKWLKF